MTIFLAGILAQSKITAVSMYYLTVKTNPPGITTIPGEGWYVEGTTLSLAAPNVVDGYLFDYWDVDGFKMPGNPIMVTMDMNHTATAHYKLLPVHNIDTGLNYSTIQAAIDAPETLDGHTIMVDAGTYIENLDVDKSLKIHGTGAEVTIINATSSLDDGTYLLNCSSVIIEGFTIISGSGYYAVYLDKVDNCRISNNVIIGSTGRGIFLSGSNNNTVSGNDIYSLFGNGIDLADSSNHNRIINNYLSLNKYGITVMNASNYNVISGNFVNSSDWVGVRLNWLGAGLAPVVGNNITNNTLCNNYEGILLDEPANDNFVYNNLIYGNYYGMRLRQDCTHYNTINHNTLTSNTYGILLESTHSNLIYDNFLNNTNNAWDNGVNGWNATKQAGPNIVGGPYIGGNYYIPIPPETDTDDDGIGDEEYEIPGGDNIDHLPLLIRDIAVTGVMPSKTVVGQGYSASINVTVENQGDITETSYIWMDGHTISCMITEDIGGTALHMTSGSSTTITFTWNTTGVAKDSYIISAHATPVPPETDTTDNNLTDGIITVTIPGDVDGDFEVDIYDVVKICTVYGSRKGDPKYVPNRDINGDGIINLYDVVIACIHYGQRDCP